MMHRYVPPRFDLFEFDDEPHSPSRQGQRRFNGWNGLVDQPAEEVSLGWFLADAAVLVATSGRFYDTAWARLSAAHLALGGTALEATIRPGTAEDMQRELERITSTGELWSTGPAMVPDGSPSDAAVCDGFSLAYGRIDGETVLVAAVGIRPEQFKVRIVRDWAAYDIDATQSHPLSELSR